jgi:hypothetical protein
MLFNQKREDFITSIADMLKIKLQNSVSKEFLEVETAWIREEWYLDFLKHLGNTKSEYKRPIEHFTIAINGYKTIKFQKLYGSIYEKTRELVSKLQVTFSLFDSTPPENITYKSFSDTNRETGEKSPTFDEKMMNVLKIAGDWHELYNRKNDTYSLTELIDKAYKQSIENIIKDTAIALGNTSQLGHHATKLVRLVGGEPTEVKQYDKKNPKISSMIKGAMAHDIGMSKRAGA